MPFINYRAKRAVMTPTVLMLTARLVRIRKHGLDNLTIRDVYQITDDEPDPKWNRNGTLIVILQVNGSSAKFIHLSGKDIQYLLDSFQPEFHPEPHSLRIDYQLTIDKDYDTVYTRY